MQSGEKKFSVCLYQLVKCWTIASISFSLMVDDYTRLPVPLRRCITNIAELCLSFVRPFGATLNGDIVPHVILYLLPYCVPITAALSYISPCYVCENHKSSAGFELHVSISLQVAESTHSGQMLLAEHNRNNDTAYCSWELDQRNCRTITAEYCRIFINCSWIIYEA